LTRLFLQSGLDSLTRLYGLESLTRLFGLDSLQASPGPEYVCLGNIEGTRRFWAVVMFFVVMIVTRYTYVVCLVCPSIINPKILNCLLIFQLVNPVFLKMFKNPIMNHQFYVQGSPFDSDRPRIKVIFPSRQVCRLLFHESGTIGRGVWWL